MGVVSVSPIGHGKRKLSWPDTFNLAVDQAERTLVEPYRVVTDSPSVPPSAMLTQAWAAGLPAQWARHSVDTDLVALRFSAEETEDPQRWILNVEYGLSIDPQDEPAVVSVSTGSIELVVESDVLTDKPIANSAYDAFDPPPTAQEGYLVVSVAKNLLSVDENDVVQNYLFRTNLTAWRGFPIGQAWLASFGYQQAYRNGVHYVETKWDFQVRARGWQVKPLDCGYRFLVGGVPVNWLTPGGPLSSPGLLDGHGGKLANGAAAVFRAFTVYRGAEFNALPLFGR